MLANSSLMGNCLAMTMHACEHLLVFGRSSIENESAQGRAELCNAGGNSSNARRCRLECRDMGQCNPDAFCQVICLSLQGVSCQKQEQLTLKLEKVTKACESPSTRGAKKNSNSLLSFGLRASTSGPTSWSEP